MPPNARACAQRLSERGTIRRASRASATFKAQKPQSNTSWGNGRANVPDPGWMKTSDTHVRAKATPRRAIGAELADSRT